MDATLKWSLPSLKGWVFVSLLSLRNCLGSYCINFTWVHLELVLKLFHLYVRDQWASDASECYSALTALFFLRSASYTIVEGHLMLQVFWRQSVGSKILLFAPEEQSFKSSLEVVFWNHALPLHHCISLKVCLSMNGRNFAELRMPDFCPDRCLESKLYFFAIMEDFWRVHFDYGRDWFLSVYSECYLLAVSFSSCLLQVQGTYDRNLSYSLTVSLRGLRNPRSAQPRFNASAA